MRICCCGHVFTMSLPSKDCIFIFHHSGFSVIMSQYHPWLNSAITKHPPNVGLWEYFPLNDFNLILSFFFFFKFVDYLKRLNLNHWTRFLFSLSPAKIFTAISENHPKLLPFHLNHLWCLNLLFAVGPYILTIGEAWWKHLCSSGLSQLRCIQNS